MDKTIVHCPVCAYDKIRASKKRKTRRMPFNATVGSPKCQKVGYFSKKIPFSTNEKRGAIGEFGGHLDKK